ncbi:hypothetical protein GIB67_018389 [Kingdonia uniflora]|uniref:non-specific serine/threonine protein kinase n=1 Tax=Kingdonia uniflora TaxID=39325 RepID=A0A7J7MJF1_9MAGN|nr:hypothetical protein GIB67_018389 [Kingdonia uniflora]
MKTNQQSLSLSRSQMNSRRRNNGVTDFWSEVTTSHKNDEEQQQQRSQIAVIYRRRRDDPTRDNYVPQIVRPEREIRVSLLGFKRISWNRSLSTRGRTSISVSSGANCRQPKQREPKRKPKQALPNRKFVQPPNYEKERAYFEEVDSFELLEESPSPKHFGTWAMGVENDQFVLPHVSTRLGKWLVSKQLNYSCEPSSSLSSILETPVTAMDCDFDKALFAVTDKTPEQVSRKTFSSLLSVPESSNLGDVTVGVECCGDIADAIKRLSLSPQPVSLDGGNRDPFAALLKVCKQSTPTTLSELFSQYCDPCSIVKVGEGTYGEAYKVGSTVCKIVPIDGDFRVNGEVQKKSGELLEEVVLSWTLNLLRSNVDNACTTFIETIDLRLCEGSYDAALIGAWEDWDVKHGSENDHPIEFPNKQVYVVFVLAHGGKDLESFVLLNFDEARSILIQVAAALAVAESAYEFEHRDLHWGNILLCRKEDATVMFTLEGKQMWAKTFGLSVSIIDFTLSRINTGEAIHFLDLASDPELFEGPKGDRQSETYRKMKEITEDCWEESFPKTNVLWLQYLVDVLLLKKSYKRTSKDDRDLRSLKKRLNNYDSAKEALSDPFFCDLLVEHACEEVG